MELNQQLQQHPSILPVDFDINLGGDLVLNVPPPVYEPDYPPSGAARNEFDDQRVPVAKLSQSSSGEPSSPQVSFLMHYVTFLNTICALLKYRVYHTHVIRSL